MKRVIIVLAMTLAASSAMAKSPQPRVPGIYSDLRRSIDTDDVDGTEIIIVGRYARYFVFYEYWEGGSQPPVAVPAAIKGNHISFSVPAPDGDCAEYEGTISARGFDGTCTVLRSTDGAALRSVHLPRRAKTFWQ